MSRAPTGDTVGSPITERSSQVYDPRPVPVLSAAPGDTLAVGTGYRWVAYRYEGETVAACYVAGRLLRRDHRGWWVANFPGKREDVQGDPVSLLAGTAPDSWPIHPEQVELVEVDR